MKFLTKILSFYRLLPQTRELAPPPQSGKSWTATGNVRICLLNVNHLFGDPLSLLHVSFSHTAGSAFHHHDADRNECRRHCQQRLLYLWLLRTCWILLERVSIVEGWLFEDVVKAHSYLYFRTNILHILDVGIVKNNLVIKTVFFNRVFFFFIDWLFSFCQDHFPKLMKSWFFNISEWLSTTSIFTFPQSPHTPRPTHRAAALIHWQFRYNKENRQVASTDVYMPLLLPLDCSSIYQPNVNKADCLVSAV